MAKLQLYITKSTAGFKFACNINPAEDIRARITDLRDAVSTIDYDSTEKNIFYMLKSTDDGIFVIILRTIPPQPGSHLAAWIYIANDIIISADELENIVRTTTRKISSSDVSNSDIAELREVFKTDYAIDREAPTLTASHRGGEYAWRIYGGDDAPALHEFFGRGRWQQSYLPFAGVILLDAELNICASGTDISDIPLGEQAVILPPEDSADGFKPYIFGRLLDKPMRATLGNELTIAWRRPGFEDVKRTETITTKEFTPTVVVTDDSRKTIAPTSFLITSQLTHKAVTDCQIRVNGVDIVAGGHSFTCNELASALVVISCEGYFPYSGHLDLASTTRALIQLQERCKTYVFEVPVKSSDLGAPIKFEINSKTPLTDSPLEGYRLLDDIQEGPTRTNHLGYKGSPLGAMTQKIVYIVIGVVVGILLTLPFGKCSSSHSPALTPTGASDTTAVDSASKVSSTTSEVAAELTKTTPLIDEPVKQDKNEVTENDKQKEEQAKAQNASVADAVKYLDSSKKWSREDMEKYSALNGLFDDMNNLRLQRIIDVWGPKLNNSQNFADIAKHAKMGLKKKHREAPYNKPGDNEISVQSYLNTIDP